MQAIGNPGCDGHCDQQHQRWQRERQGPDRNRQHAPSLALAQVGPSSNVVTAELKRTHSDASWVAPYSAILTDGAIYTQNDDFDPAARPNNGGGNSAVPEPGTYAMLLSGLMTVGFVARRRRAQSAGEPRLALG
jgi:hypothetical protein